MVNEAKGRLYRRRDGKYLMYIPKALAEDSMFPFKATLANPVVRVKISFKVSAKLIDMLNQLPRKTKRVFKSTQLATVDSLRVTFCASRKKAAKKLANPRIMSIHFHTFRHWKATMEYHRTKDIMHVQSMLGHKRINNTQIYINLEQAIFSLGDNSEYTTRIAKTVRGARVLLEAGFEYVTDMDGFKIFRKRK